MKKYLFLLFVAASLVACKKDKTTDPMATSNTITFDSTFKNVVMTSAAYNGKWQLNAVIDLPAVAGFSRKLAFNLNFLQKPTANATYTIVTTDGEISATTAMLYINHVDYNPSPTDNISQSYFLKQGSTGSITLSVTGGKISIQFSGVTLTGNRGGGDKSNVAATLTEN